MNRSHTQHRRKNRLLVLGWGKRGYISHDSDSLTRPSVKEKLQGGNKSKTKNFTELHSSPPYPIGFFTCQFHKSWHIVSRSAGALKPSSFSARDGSAVKSGTSPRLTENVSYGSGHQPNTANKYLRPMISYL